MSDSLSCLMSRMEMERDAGPWGPRLGMPFDDGVFFNVEKVTVHLEKSSQVNYGIKFGYTTTDGKVCSSPIYGGKYGDIIDEINLDGIDEYLTGVSGYYGPVEVEYYKGWEGITSISFHTNKKVYGPYGIESSGEGCVPFTSIVKASPGKVVGFHGRYAEPFPTAIGVHVKYF